MSQQLDREGIFKARPVSWNVQDAKESQAAAVSLQLEILSEWDGSGQWHDWAQYEPHTCYGSWWVVRRDGRLNAGPVEQLAASLGWSGDLRDVFGGPPPNVVVQITVKGETYEGRTQYRATWMNPEEYEPRSGASEETVNGLQARYGSMLRAAAAAAGQQPPPVASPGAAPAAGPPPPADNEPPPITAADVPFYEAGPLERQR